jgi:hypothetical protein
MVRLVAYLQIMVMLSSPFVLAGRLSPEIGVLGIKSWTNNHDLRHPYGFGLYLLQPVSEKVKLVFEYEYLTNTQKTFGYYRLNPWSYESESIRDVLCMRNRVSSFQFGLMHTVTHSRTTYLEFGGGICAVVMERDGHLKATGIDWGSSDAGMCGLVLDIGLLVTELKDLPLVMRFGFKHRFLSGSCTSSCYGCNSAFSDLITTTEVSWGFGYQFGR